MNPVTVSFLSCKRIKLFEKNFRAFWKYCQDPELIDKVIVLDDNSSEKDRKIITDLLSEVKIPNMFIQKNIMKGLAQSMNLCYDLCQSKYLFIVEDDWRFIREGKMLGMSLEIMAKYPHVKKVCVDFSSSGKDRSEISDYEILFTESGEPYFIDEYLDKSRWPSFTFRQGVLDKEVCRAELGDFRLIPELAHNHMTPTSETDYAVRFCNKGYRTAYFLESFVEECFGPSCFDLNNINRHDESR